MVFEQCKVLCDIKKWSFSIFTIRKKLVSVKKYYKPRMLCISPFPIKLARPAKNFFVKSNIEESYSFYHPCCQFITIRIVYKYNSKKIKTVSKLIYTERDMENWISYKCNFQLKIICLPESLRLMLQKLRSLSSKLNMYFRT